MAGEPGVSANNVTSRGKIRLFTGPAKVGQPFTATAYVKQADGQNVTIKLQSGVKLAGSKVAQPAKTDAGKDYAQVSWRLVADTAGQYAHGGHPR